MSGSHEERKFLKLFQRFDRDTYGRLHGLRHYVPQGKCACLICQQKGHATPPNPSEEGLGSPKE